MHDSVEQPKEKDQWQILSDHERERLSGEIARLKERQEELVRNLTREASTTVFYTAEIPSISPPLPLPDRLTCPDGTNITTNNFPDALDLTAIVSEETDRIQSELEMITGQLEINGEQRQQLDLLEKASEVEKQAWIKQAVDRTFRNILMSYPLSSQPAQATDHKRPHRVAQPDNAWPALIALLIYPTLCTADNKDDVLGRFVNDNKDNFTLKHGRIAEVMLDRARVFGLIPNTREDKEQQSKDLLRFLQRH